MSRPDFDNAATGSSDGCFDLSTQQRWRVFYSADHVPGTRVDPWNLELHGPRGSEIYPAGGEELCAFTSRRRLRDKLEALGRVTQRGDYELTIRFPADRLDQVAELLRCFRRRSLSAEQKTRAAESLRRWRERGGNAEDRAPDRDTARRSPDREEHEGCDASAAASLNGTEYAGLKPETER